MKMHQYKFLSYLMLICFIGFSITKVKAYCAFSRQVYNQGSVYIYVDGYSYPDFSYSDGCRDCPVTFYYGCHRCNWSAWLVTNKNGNPFVLGYTFEGMNAVVDARTYSGIYLHYSGVITYQVK